MNKISLGISPCPNDTFMFYQLLHNSPWAMQHKIDLHMADVEELNQACLQQKLEISKVSFHVLGKLRENYCLLSAGAALGRGCGPLIVSKEKLDSLEGKTVAIPGMNTTAFLLLKCYAPDNIIIKEMIFSDIMPAVKNGEVDAGLIIHESRFTYKEQGLNLIADLGAWWEDYSGLPIPLGGIIASRKLPKEQILEFNALLKNSVKTMLNVDWQNSPELIEFIKSHSQEIEPEVLKAHIDTYVNEESIELSSEGRRGIEKLFQVAEERGFIKPCSLPLFAEDM
ncbi:MAG: 1,4-dihydroxy-6-naphthoate synthase [Lentisphaeraceae bacterium]|nr:1,4-dihydroxy-6-naphthoate synthase [Lentisphaeraceae bacterium]